MIVIGNYDFRASGTVAKSIEIAGAVQAAGLPVALWAIEAKGPLLQRVPEGIPVHQLGHGPARGGRVAGLIANLPYYAMALRRRTPTVLLSGGNHFHLPSRIALRLSGRRSLIRYGARASNSSQRADRSRTGIVGDIRSKFGDADFVTAVSQELADELRSADLHGQLRTIANGVDLDRVARLAVQESDHPWLRAPDAPVLATMGRIEKQKAFDIAIQALARLPRETKARLIVIGAGKPERIAALRGLADREGVADRVDFAGYQTNPFAILSRADLFVSGSRWEGASNTLIEALACGLPIVATDCPTGNREVVEHGPYGSIVPMDDPAAMADAILRELALRRDRSAQAAGARHWSLDACLDQWTRLLATEHERALALR